MRYDVARIRTEKNRLCAEAQLPQTRIFSTSILGDLFHGGGSVVINRVGDGPVERMCFGNSSDILLASFRDEQ